MRFKYNLVPGRYLWIALLVTLLSACASQQTRPGFYWGNYEQSLYTLTDNPGERASQRHFTNLRQVLSYSDARGMLPPPGAMLELAALEAQAGNQAAYVELVNREYQLYPESRVFIHRWFSDVTITQLGAIDESTDDSTDDSTEELPDAQ